MDEGGKVASPSGAPETESKFSVTHLPCQTENDDWGKVEDENQEEVPSSQGAPRKVFFQ